MKWYQQDLEQMRKSAKKQYSQTRPMPCRFCGKVIRVDMYRHVARLHLDLVQLWRCPIAWYTTWKGSPQDCLEHLRNGHDAPWISKTASIEKYAPPWTVCRQLWTDSLRVEHSGISTDILLFSEVGLSLTQHYRVYRGGLPHAVFRTDYIDRLRSLLRSSGQSRSPPETERTSTPKSVRQLHRSSQPKRLFSEAVDDEPCLTVQNPADVVGETVFDCRPSVLLDSIAGAWPRHDGRSRWQMDMDTNEITISRIVGFEWDEAGTDLEDEGPTAVASPVEVVTDPFDCGDNFDFDLAKVMCDVSVIPSIITPIEELEVQPPSTAAENAAPATPAFENVVESPGYTVPEDSGLAWIQGFALVSETALNEEDGHWLSLKNPSPLPVPSLAATPVVVPVVEGPAAPTMPPTPDDARIKSDTGGVRQADRAQVFMVESTAGSTSSPLCQATEDISPELTREGPFDAGEVISEPGQSPLVLNSMPGCQFHMTSYDDRDNRDDLDPEYGIHVHV